LRDQGEVAVIVVFGSILMDFRVNVPALPGPSETAVVRDGFAEAGGKGANQAVAAARQGSRVVMVGAVGNDAIARPALAGLIGDGVDVSRVREVPALTGFSIMIGTEATGRRTAAAANANRFATTRQVEDALLAPENLLLLQTETDVTETAALIMRAKRLGARIVLHFSPPAHLPPDAMRALDYLIVGEDEAQWLGHRLATGHNPASLHAALGIGVIQSRGPKGLEAASHNGHWQLPAHPIDLVESSGAGDVLSGIFAACIDQQMAMEPALRRANAGAALSCTRVTTQRNIPTAAEIDRRIWEWQHEEVL
jgi:ribokinase